MRTWYLDFKEGDGIRIANRQIRVLSIDKDGSMELRINNKKHYLEKGEYIPLDRINGMYNFGSRGRGRRSHVRLQLVHEYHKLRSLVSDKTGGER